MRDKEQSRYLKIGVFVLLCTGLIVVGIIIFGSFHLFERRLYVETYFNESVQGLAIGSPVKYRGIDIGRVQAINFVSNIYNVSHKDNKYARYIYVLLSLKPNFLKDMKDVDFSKQTTTSQYKKDTFIYDFLSSMRQKLNDPLGKRSKKN